MSLTDHAESKRERHFRLRVHLTFINAGIPLLGEFDEECPILGPVGPDNLKPLVGGVRENAGS
jgi:hypothetical protein